MNSKQAVRGGVLVVLMVGIVVGLQEMQRGTPPAEQGKRSSKQVPDQKEESIIIADNTVTEVTTPDASNQVVRVGAGSHSYPVAAGEIMIQARSEVSAGDIELLASSLGSQVLRGDNRSGLYRLKVPQGQTMEVFRSTLLTAPEVQDATFNALVEATSLTMSCPAGANRAKQWNLDSIQQITACSSFNSSINSIVVAVMDSGVAFENYSDGKSTYAQASDLAQVSFVSGYDFANNDSHPNDDNQHGTHIAGIIGAQGGVSGVAPGVKIMPIKVLNADKMGYEMDVVNGILYAVDHGANVINMSFSFGAGYFPSTALQAAIAYAADHHVLMVASVGNGAQWGVSYPGAFPDVIAVGASRPGLFSSYQAAYSNKGYRLDLLAPGGLIGADLAGLGMSNGILAQTFALKSPTHIGYWFFSGTSQAAAHVSGAVAWLLADGLPPEQVKDVLIESAFNMGGAGFDPNLGSGSLQLQAARDMVRLNTVEELPTYYVNIVPFLKRVSGLNVVTARIEVMNANGEPAAYVKVGGSWFGSYTAFDALATTDYNGVAWVTTPQFSAPSGVAVSFQVDMVAGGAARFPSEPRQFYSLSPLMGEVFSRLLVDPVAGNSVVLYKVDPSDSAISSLISTSGLVRSYIMKPIGAGLRSGPLALVIDDVFAPKIANPDSNTTSTITWNFPGGLNSGRGTLSSFSGTLLNAPTPIVGPAARILVLPLDPAMARRNLSQSYPIINGYDSEFQAVNQGFGNRIGQLQRPSGFPTSGMGTGYYSGTLGDGFLTSSMGTGFLTSSMGTGFLTSSMGSGFLTSSMGTGFLTSSMGSGFMTSSMGSGFLASSMGSGFLASSMGSSFASSLLISIMTNNVVATGYAGALDGTSNGNGVIATSFTDLGMDDVSGTDGTGTDPTMPDAEGLQLDEFDPGMLITSEEELEDLLGVPPYPMPADPQSK